MAETCSPSQASAPCSDSGVRPASAIAQNWLDRRRQTEPARTGANRRRTADSSAIRTARAWLCLAAPIDCTDGVAPVSR